MAKDDPTGFVYLRHQPHYGYCFGRCKVLSQRNSQYSKPNPFIDIPVDCFSTRDMFAAERELQHRLRAFRIANCSCEWAQDTPEVLEIWQSVKNRHVWQKNVDGKYCPIVRQIPLF